MRKRSSKKRPTDPNALAAQIVAESTEEYAEDEPEPTDEAKEAARLLGRRGGLKGGPARAARLSKERRSEIAKLAASARWKKTGG